MALSNWDTIALDKDGKSCNGEMPFLGDIQCSIYKNWLSVKGPHNLEIHINHGDLDVNVCESKQLYSELTIHAKRGPQNSIFVFVKHTNWYKKPYEKTIFSGIGAYGFKDYLDWIKETQPDLYATIPEKYINDSNNDYLMTTCSKQDSWKIEFFGGKDKEKFSIEVPTAYPSLGDLWIGIKQETFDSFIEWLKEIDEEEYANLILQNQDIKRFNQGDKFFADAFGIDVEKTSIDESNIPLIRTFIEGIKQVKEEIIK